MSALGLSVGTLVMLLLLLFLVKAVVGMTFAVVGWAGVVAFGLLVGGVATYAGTVVLTDETDFWDALGTTTLSALATFPVAWIPGVGTALAMLVWLAVLEHRTPGEWFAAGVVAAVSWGVAFAVTGVFALFGAHVDAVGVPGV
ncbi:hypothetical protein [Halospeciosus flavus]|uniref:Yip1 domain-containing protein n=1 Tax=Halospeciosus flavus TaxID=3032283 RepID=A0ABD5Z4V0_9EURY|nr:hypothetical protein [Halospeciosus flavus]